MKPAIPAAVLVLVAASGAALASPPETKLDDMKEICELLATIGAHVRPRPTRAALAEDAAFYDRIIDYPAALADLQVRRAPDFPTLLERKLYRSSDELVLSEDDANLVPPPSFIAACRAARHAGDLRTGEIDPTPFGGRLDRARGAPAVVSDGSTASVTWHHDGFPYLFMLTLKRDSDGRWRIEGSRAWPCSAPL